MIGPLLWFLGYFTVALLTARAAYGIQRARMIEQLGEELGALDPDLRFRDTGREPAATAALLYGLAWPLVVPVYLFSRLVMTIVTARPPRSDYERAVRAARSRERIGELEESLGMSEHGMCEHGVREHGMSEHVMREHGVRERVRR